MNFLVLGMYILTVMTLIITPGPVLLLIASLGLKERYSTALKAILGADLASLILATISIFVLKGLLVIDQRIFILIRLIGCLYIAHIGYKLLKEAYFIKENGLQPLKPTKGGFKKGFLVRIFNPGDIIFFTSLFPQFVNVHTNLNTGLLILVMVWVIVDLFTLSLIYKGFNLLSGSTIYPKILGVCATLLIALAIYGLYISLMQLLQSF
ncbi:MAG: LysE family translocator [Neisseriaceae bacterium]